MPCFTVAKVVLQKFRLMLNARDWLAASIVRPVGPRLTMITLPRVAASILMASSHWVGVLPESEIRFTKQVSQEETQKQAEILIDTGNTGVESNFQAAQKAAQYTTVRSGKTL